MLNTPPERGMMWCNSPACANGGDTFVPEQIGQPRWENYQIRQAAEEKRLAPGCPVLGRMAHQPEGDDGQQDQRAKQRADGDKAIRRDTASFRRNSEQ